MVVGACFQPKVDQELTQTVRIFVECPEPNLQFQHKQKFIESEHFTMAQ